VSSATTFRSPRSSADVTTGRGSQPAVATAGWAIGLAAGVALAAAAWSSYAEISLWLAPQIVVMTGIAGHMLATSRTQPPFPHICTLFSGIQLVLMPWFAWYHPPENPAYDIGFGTGAYLSYVTPLWLAYAIGWFSPLLGTPPKGDQPDAHPSPRADSLKRDLDILLFGGLASSAVAPFVNVSALAFVFVLLTNLKFVGAAGWLLIRSEGWLWRVGLALLTEIVISSRQAMFGGLALWTASLLALFVYQRAIHRGVLFLLLAFMFVAIPGLEEAKLRLRDTTWRGERTSDRVFGMDLRPEGLNIPVVWFLYFAEGLLQTVTLTLSEEDLSHLSVRYNHGWIVARVMNTVPEIEPYANGETIIGAFSAAAIPRVVSPDKYVAGGEYFERFTQTRLYDSRTGERLASMNLGFAGEFYANFGFTGGIIAGGLWGLVSGLIFRWFRKRGSICHLWWAFYPYIFSYGMKAEEGVGEILNWLVKATIVAAAVIYLLPALRNELFRRRTKAGENES
jgi:hypothetical protein